MEKLDAKALPPEVLDAVAQVEAILQDRFAGRRSVPAPLIGQFQIGDDETMYFVIAPPGLVQRETMMKAALALDKARDRGADALADALKRYRSICIVECVYYVSGMPPVEAKKDPRVVARDYLKQLLEEPQPLGDAFAEVSNAVVESLTPTRGATLGKL